MLMHDIRSKVIYKLVLPEKLKKNYYENLNLTDINGNKGF